MKHSSRGASPIRRSAAALATATSALLLAGCANGWPGLGAERVEPLNPPPMGAGPLIGEDPAYARPRGAYGPGTVMPGGTAAPPAPR